MRKRVICVVTLGMAAALAQAAVPVERRIVADPAGQVSISNVAGRVSVLGWDKAEVRVSGTLGEGVERLDVLQDGKDTVVKVVLPRVSMSRKSGDAQIEVRVPATARVVVRTVSADIDSTAVTGTQDIKSVSGDVTAQLAGASVVVSAVSGDVTLSGSAQPSELRVKSISGDVRLNRGAGVLELETISGDVKAEVVPASSLRLRTVSGDMSIRTRLLRDASVDISSVSGDLSLSGPSEAGFTTDVESSNGDIDTCFGVEAVPVSKYGPGSRLQTTRGQGAARIRVRSTSGDVNLCDK